MAAAARPLHPSTWRRGVQAVDQVAERAAEGLAQAAGVPLSPSVMD